VWPEHEFQSILSNGCTYILSRWWICFRETFFENFKNEAEIVVLIVQLSFIYQMKNRQVELKNNKSNAMSKTSSEKHLSLLRISAKFYNTVVEKIPYYIINNY